MRNSFETINIKGAKAIKAFAFSRCYSLKQAKIEAESIEKCVFAYCKNLESVYLKNVKKCDIDLFADCTNLKTVYMEGCENMEEVCEKYKNINFISTSIDELIITYKSFKDINATYNKFNEDFEK